MNKVKYTGYPSQNFPLSTQGMDFIGSQIQLLSEFARMAGGNYILSGCAPNGNSYGAGVMIINGEIIPFVPSNKQSSIRIRETTNSVTAGSTTYTDAYTTRVAEFGSNVAGVETYPWDTFSPFPTNQYLLENSATKKELEELKNLAMPKGAIIMWSGTIANIPTGFVLCNGATVNGLKTPDLRGRFVVGYSDLPSQKDYTLIGSTGGRETVTLESNEIPSHKHIVPWGDVERVYQPPWGLAPGKNQVGSKSTDNDNSWGYTSPIGGGDAHENRPPYYTLAYIIKTV